MVYCNCDLGEGPQIKDLKKEVKIMFYDKLDKIEQTNGFYGVTPLWYVVLGCAR